jgi:hypothetical protein
LPALDWDVTLRGEAEPALKFLVSLRTHPPFLGAEGYNYSQGQKHEEILAFSYLSLFGSYFHQQKQTPKESIKVKQDMKILLD